MQVRDGSRTLNAVIVGSTNVNPGYILVGNKNLPAHRRRLRQDLRSPEEPPLRPLPRRARSLLRLLAKIDKMKAESAQNAFIDPDGYKAYVAERDDDIPQGVGAAAENASRLAPIELSSLRGSFASCLLPERSPEPWPRQASTRAAFRGPPGS